MKVISLSNQKGGVGKTTLALALAAGLKKRGYRVLAIDADPQANFSTSVGFEEGPDNKNLYNVFTGAKVKDNTVTTNLGFDLVKGSLRLTNADREFSALGSERIIKKALKHVTDDYDFCIIDTPPTLGILTTCALVASDAMVIPVQASLFSLQGIFQLNTELIQKIKEDINPGLQVAGIVINQYNPQATVRRSMKEEIESIAETLDFHVFDSIIRSAAAAEESHLLRTDITSSKTKISADLNAYIDELLKRLGE